MIALFAESNTVDDLGIGAVRDAFSDLLFPGLSTVQTRVRYLLFVPWIYQRLERERVSSDRAEAKTREWELDLIFALLRGGSTDSVIGQDAKRSLKQLPSFIYWRGLRSFGIRTFDGTRSDYWRALNRLNSAPRTHRADGDDLPTPEHSGWHRNLHVAPSNLWKLPPWISTGPRRATSRSGSSPPIPGPCWLIWFARRPPSNPTFSVSLGGCRAG